MSNTNAATEVAKTVKYPDELIAELTAAIGVHKEIIGEASLEENRATTDEARRDAQFKRRFAEHCIKALERGIRSAEGIKAGR